MHQSGTMLDVIDKPAAPPLSASLSRPPPKKILTDMGANNSFGGGQKLGAGR